MFTTAPTNVGPFVDYIREPASAVVNTTMAVVHIDGFTANFVDGTVDYVPISGDTNKEVIVSDFVEITHPSTFFGKVAFDNALFLGVVQFECDVRSTGSLEFRKKVTFRGNATLGRECQFHASTMFFGDVRLRKECQFHPSAPVVFNGEARVGVRCRFLSSVQFIDRAFLGGNCWFAKKVTFEKSCHFQPYGEHLPAVFCDKVLAELDTENDCDYANYTCRIVPFRHYMHRW